MKTVHRLGIAGLLVVLSAAVSLLAAPALPARMVTHWNAAGQPDGTMAKSLALPLFPVLSGVLVVVLAFVPRIDPLGENVAEFRAYYDWFIVVFAGFMLLLQAGIVAFNLGYDFDFTILVLLAMAALFYYLGVLLGVAEQNWFVGIRTPWTLSSEEVWNETHALGSTLFKLTALLTLVGVFFGEYGVYFAVVPAVATAVITVAYSYYRYRKGVSENNLSPNNT